MPIRPPASTCQAGLPARRELGEQQHQRLAYATAVISLSSGLVPPLQSFVATDDAVQRVLSLLLVSLAVIAAVMVLLGARLVAEHRRGEFIMMRARGASLRQVAAVAFAAAPSWSCPPPPSRSPSAS